MKKFLSILISAMLVLTVIPMAIVSADTKLNLVDIKDQIRPVGRYEWTDSGLSGDWTASGFEFTADCEGNVALTLTAKCNDVGGKGDWNKDGYLTVYIDGVRQNYRVRYMNGTHTVNIAENVESGVHTFKVLKQNEYSTTQAVFNSITFNGTLGAKPAEQEYVIEFIGDSITSGFGSLDNPNGQASRYSDGTRTYAYITAENFGAEARIVSVSGGTMGGLYSWYTGNARNGGSYDYSLKKPTFVVNALGGNDGPKTIDYYKTHIKNYANAIRKGYNDVTIPIVHVTDIMNTGDALRYNISQAIKAIQKEDPVAYGNIYNVFCNTVAGGHPNQSQHLTAANRLTREIVELGIMPASALRDDATIVLKENTNETTNINNFDSVVWGNASNSGVKGELVAPLDPADADSETAKAVKYTADGTQSAAATRTFRVKAGTISSINTTKGFSFYINYKDTDYTGAEGETYTSPKYLFSRSDKFATMTVPGVTDGTTQKVEIYWNEIPENSYVFVSGLYGSDFILGFDFFGSCEYIIDNLKAINYRYMYSSNSNKAYTYSSGYDSYPLMGVTDNYVAATTVTTNINDVETLSPEDVTNPDNWVVGWYDASTGVYNPKYNGTLENERAAVKSLVKIDASNIYGFTILNNDEYGLRVVIREYDSNGKFIRSWGSLGSGEHYTPTDSNVKYASVTIYGNVANTIDLVKNNTISVIMQITGEVPSSSSTTTTTTTTTQKQEESSSTPEESSSVPAGENGIVKTVVYTMDESGISTNNDPRHPEKAEIVDSGEADYGKVMKMGAYGDTHAYLYFPKIKASDYDYGIITKITFDYKLKTNGIWLYQGLKVRYNGTWTNAIYDSKVPGYKMPGPANQWLTCTIDFTDANPYYPTLSNAINAGIDGIQFAQTKSTTNFYVDNITVYVEKFSENRAEQPKPAAPVATEVTGTSITLQAVTNAMYSKDGGATWQVSNKFTGLSPATEYQFAMKLKQTVDYFESEVSDIAKISTLTEYTLSFKDLGFTSKTTAASGKSAFETAQYKESNVAIALTTTRLLFAGDKMDFTSKASVVAGKYKVILQYRAYSGRSDLDITMGDSVYKSFVSATSGGNGTKADLFAEYVHSTDGPVNISLDVLTDGSCYLEALILQKVGDVETDGQITTALATESTASIRLGEVKGMRFYTSVDEEALAALVGDKEYEVGTLIAPKDKIGDHLTIEDSVAKVVYDYAKYGLYDGKYVVGSIVNIKSSNNYNAQTGNLARDFVARAYVLVDGVYYYSASTCVRNIAQIADSFIADANGGYNALDADIKELVDTWAKAND